jgi:DNA-binding MarR family transcriptional regulator
MTNEEETLAAVEALKRALRAAGKTYGQVAEHLGVSLPTVKRMLTRGAMPLPVFARIAAFAGTTMGDLLADARDAATRMTYFDRQQDEAFAARPALLTYFTLLTEGRTPRAIAREHGLPPASTVKYLQALEAVGLVEVLPHDRVHLLGSPPFVFAADSVSQRRNLEVRARETLDTIFARWGAPGGPSGEYLVVKPLSVTTGRHVELLKEVTEVIVKHSVAAEREARTSSEPRREIVVVAACDYAVPRKIELPRW